MKCTKRILSSVLAFAVVLTSVFLTGTMRGFSANETVLLPKGSTWSYLETPAASRFADTVWTEGSYSIGSWASGKAPFGFCSSGKPMESLIFTRLQNTKGKANPVYFRTTFELTGLGSVQALAANIDYDDGVRIYLNGVKAGQINVPDTADANAPDPSSDYLVIDDTIGSRSLQLAPSLLREGTNTIAVEVWNDRLGSSDLFFDMSLVSTSQPPAEIQETVFAKGAQWSYLEAPQASRFANTDWTKAAFDVSAWPSGQTPIGYYYSGIKTSLSNTKGIANPVYLRKAFEMADTADIRSFTADLDYDDGVRIYLNGVIVAQVNVPTTAAAAAPNPSADYAVIGSSHASATIQFSAAALVQGTNILAVELWNDKPDSSDLYFDMSLTATDKNPPVTSELIEKGHIWNYLEDQSTPPADWKTSTADYPAPWKSGQNSFGYTSSGASGYAGAATKISYGTPMPMLLYFKTVVDIPDASGIYDMSANLVYDDGAVIYINGTEAGRINVTGDGTSASVGTIAGSNPASTVLDLNPALLRNGKNVIAAVVYNVNNTSSDLYFDMTVTAYDSNHPPLYGAEELSLTPGADESQLNLAWYTLRGASSASAVQIAKKSDMTGTEFPEAKASAFTGMVEDAIAGYSTNKVVVTGLEPETEYVYRVGDGTAPRWSDVYTYRTQNSSDYTALYMGDPQIGASGNSGNDTVSWKDTVARAVERNPGASFILTGGDQVDNGTSESQYDGFYSPEQLKSYAVVPTIGNHDANAPNHTYHFNKPNTGKYGQTGAGWNNYFSYGNTLYIVLNGNNDNAADHRSTIQEAVASHPDARWRIVMMHHDIYGSGKTHSTSDAILNLRGKLYPIFDEFDIDVVLTAHDHTYTRSYQLKNNMVVTSDLTETSVVNPEGTLYITANSSTGSKYYDLSDTYGFYVANRSQLRTPTYAALEISDTRFAITTYRVDTGEATDSYSITKEGTRAELGTLISEAAVLHDNAAEGTRPGEYPAGSKSTLQDAIDTAQAVYDNPTSLQSEISTAIQVLAEAKADFEASVIPIQKGDFNRDGEVSALDIMSMRKFMMGDTPPAAEQLEGGDLNGDGAINPVDIMLLRKMLLAA